MVVAIDGTSASGKSTLAKLLSKHLNLPLFNVGMVYRALTLFFKKNSIKPSQESVEKCVDNIDIQVKFINDNQVVYVNGECFSSEHLFSSETAQLTPKYAEIEALRVVVRKCQRDYAKNNSVLMEGRDITSEVLPWADVKFFINCSYKEKVKRRMAQLNEIGENISKQNILDDLFMRDLSDVDRCVSPMSLNSNVIYIDTSGLSLDQTIEKMLKIIKG